MMHKFFKFSVIDIMFIILLVTPGLAILMTTGDISIYFKFDVLDGQFVYVLSKFFGLYAIFFFFIQLIFILYSTSLKNKNNPYEDSRLHRSLGLATLGFIVLHVSFFVLAVSIRNGNFAYHLLLPNFFGNYYPFMVSLGVVAFMLIAFSLVSVIVYRKKNSTLYLWGHRLMLPAFILVLVHSYTIGSETRLLVIQLAYMAMLIALLYFISFKLFNAKINMFKGKV